MKTKKLFKFVSENTVEYVILHAIYQASRGKGPTVSWGEIRNPREALKAAKAELNGRTGMWVFKHSGFDVGVAHRIVEALGLKIPTVAEAMKHIQHEELESEARQPIISIPEFRDFSQPALASFNWEGRCPPVYTA